MNYIEQIKEYGYCLIPQVLPKEKVLFLYTSIKSLYESTKDEICPTTPFLNQNQPTIYNLQNKNFTFIKALFEIEQVEKILIHYLNDKWYKQIPKDQPNYILRSFGARSSNTALPLHIDSFIPYKGSEVIAIQVAIMLEDSTFENGCTTVVPRSHNSGEYASNINIQPDYLVAKAGDILIWDSRLWHGTTNNKTEGTRWAIIATFTRWWIKQHFDITKALPQSIKEQLSPKYKSILGFASIPHLTEYEGIEIKRGYHEI